jgi:hypothetical protein
VSPPPGDGPTSGGCEDPERHEELDHVLRETQRIIFKYPIAAQAVIAAFAAEGRRFAETDEGREWRERLERSELYRRGREIWHLGTLGMFSAHAPGVLPSVMVEGFVRAARSRDLHALLTLLGHRSRR